MCLVVLLFGFPLTCGWCTAANGLGWLVPRLVVLWGFYMERCPSCGQICEAHISDEVWFLDDGDHGDQMAYCSECGEVSFIEDFEPVG